MIRKKSPVLFREEGGHHGLVIPGILYSVFIGSSHDFIVSSNRFIAIFFEKYSEKIYGVGMVDFFSKKHMSDCFV